MWFDQPSRRPSALLNGGLGNACCGGVTPPKRHDGVFEEWRVLVFGRVLYSAESITGIYS